MKKVGVILHGCGHQDGTEIHEAVITLLCLEQANLSPFCVSIDKPQTRVQDHLKQRALSENRNILIESARIARGKVKTIQEVSADELDGIIIPGGFGAVLNLSNYFEKGIEMSVDLELEKLLKYIHKKNKPIGAICIAPVILAKVFGGLHPLLTIGTDKETAAKIESLGAIHKNCSADDCVVDEKNRFLTTPAYMLATSIKELYSGIGKLVNRFAEFVK